MHSHTAHTAPTEPAVTYDSLSCACAITTNDVCDELVKTLAMLAQLERIVVRLSPVSSHDECFELYRLQQRVAAHHIAAIAALGARR